MRPSKSTQQPTRYFTYNLAWLLPLSLALGCDRKDPTSSTDVRATSQKTQEQTPAVAPETPETAEVLEEEPVVTRGPELVKIPGGTMTMGIEGHQNWEAPFEVTVESFEMDRTEVTAAQYAECVESGGCPEPAPGVWSEANYKKEGREQHPMNNVSWEQAKAFCEWAEKRLPTEEEWEYAARGAEGRLYAWGNEAPDEKRLNARDKQCAINDSKRRGGYNRPLFDDDGFPGTAPVGSFPLGATPLGLMDMTGNVYEWTASGMNDRYGLPRRNQRIIFRGGSFFRGEAKALLAAERSAYYPKHVSIDIGFRCAR